MISMLLHPFAWGLLHLLWQGVVIAGAVMIAFALIPSRHAAWRHRVAFAALALLLVLPAANTVLVLAARADPGSNRWMDASASGSTTAVAVRQVAVRTSLMAEWIVAGWAAGVLLLGVRLGGGLWWTRRLRRRDVAAAPARWEAYARDLAMPLGIEHAPKVLTSPYVTVPTLAGQWPAVVLIPPALATDFSPDEARGVLAHELAHLARGDHWRNLLLAAARAVLFYHPAAHWLARRIEVERERAADDIVVALGADRIGYARTLARLEEFRGPRPRFAATQLAIPASGGNLRARILRVARNDPGRPGPLHVAAAAIPTAAIFVIGVLGALPASQAALSGRLMEIRAMDPAGAFRLSILDHRVVAARVNGRWLASGEWRQEGNVVTFSGPGAGWLQVTLRPGGISWTPRQPSSPSSIPE